MNTIAYIKRNITRIFCAILVMTIFSSCGDTAKTPEAKTEEAHEQGGHEESEGLELTQEQLNAVGIVIGGITQKNLTEVVKSSGQLAVPPQNAAQINVLSGGIIRRINVIEGQKVKKGQVLVTIENQDLIRLQQDYLTAKGGFSYVEAEYNRQQQLKAANAGTGKAHQQAEANYNAERAKIKALERQLQQYGISASRISSGNITSQIPVTAPINGTIGKINAETGSYAQPGVSIMDIVDNSKIHADLIVFEKDLSKIKVGQRVDFQLTNQKNEQIEGEIYGINKSFENDSKGVVVHAVIKKPGANLIPGMYVTGLIGVGTSMSNAVPVDAVVRTEGKEFIFIVDTGAGAAEHHKEESSVHFKKIEVSTGVAELGYIQVNPLQKLPADVRVVIKGAFYLQSKSSGTSEHSH
ncbi:efflux RND transporter periplasmic adaptor subunit [Pedobacter heparinus]|uniref:Efflux transporter, RND family, MFP subunit n=1 Tax=Pedobacter heparinus (strain ATCC 13125 / DSM 2366 / CIP 104194 / JCM 7457 / NBRC 12017 / NCIMB 9290 / NRRL B-14731 / HIM 762-3) TaxID=485917 RepID=C6Y0V8_PEDHD|nr:efflux RND transporter periplasmic adaptor subunit [Pedobacter heparinus]ACU04885.1 efflux transporter, RND family, MFP subunit [Pedobacter heparinus DSM 2366]